MTTGRAEPRRAGGPVVHDVRFYGKTSNMEPYRRIGLVAECVPCEWTAGVEPGRGVPQLLRLTTEHAGESLELTPPWREVLAQALSDAVTYREAAASDFGCADCVAHPAGLCADHAADLDKTDAYLQLAGTLGLEVER